MAIYQWRWQQVQYLLDMNVHYLTVMSPIDADDIYTDANIFLTRMTRIKDWKH